MNDHINEVASDTLGDRMKLFESALDVALNEDDLYGIRLDGRGFSKFTKRIKALKPYDPHFMEVMECVSRDLLKEFHFATVYTQSDEITCIPYFFGDGRESYFGLRLQKLCSVMAGFASASFNYHLVRIGERRPEFKAAASSFPHFDCRVFAVPSKEEILNALIWRQRDCEKNAKNSFAQYYFTHKQLHGKNGDEQVAMVEEKFKVDGVSFTEQNPKFRLGIFVKKELVEHKGFNPIRQIEAVSLRGNISVYSEKLTFSEELLDWVTRKYANQFSGTPMINQLPVNFVKGIRLSQAE